MPVTPDAMAALRELRARDAVLLEEAAVVEALAGRTAALRRRCAEVVGELEALPAERAALERARGEAAGRVVSAERALEEARASLEAVAGARRDREARLAEAEADARAAAEALADAHRHAERLATGASELEARERALRAESEELHGRTVELAAEVAATHRVAAPAVGDVPAELEQLDVWGVRARAALFVAKGSIASERERLVAEANAVGSAALGEDVGALGVAQVIRRLEAAGA